MANRRDNRLCRFSQQLSQRLKYIRPARHCQSATNDSSSGASESPRKSDSEGLTKDTLRSVKANKNMATIKDYDSTQTIRTPESIKLMRRLSNRYPGTSPHQLRRAILAIGAELVSQDISLVVKHLQASK